MAAFPRAPLAPAHALPATHPHPRLATPRVARPIPTALTRSFEEHVAAVPAADEAAAGGQPPRSLYQPLPPSSSAPTSTSTTALLPGWHPLSSPPLWSGGDASALGGTKASPSPLAALPPAWRLLLLSDGSVTRHLQLLTGAAVVVEVLDQRVLDAPSDLASLPPSAREISGPILQRRVLLRVSTGEGGGADALNQPALVFATSWWNVADAATTLASTACPIWTSLASTRSELFREIRGVEHGGNAALSRAFGLREETGAPALWGRHYLFHRGGRPLTAIYEVFSPALGAWLGVGGAEKGLYQ